MGRILLLALCLAGGAAHAAERGDELAAQMRRAHASEGFQLRLIVRRRDADGHAPAPLKYALIGAGGGRRQALLWRLLAPGGQRGYRILSHREGAKVRIWRISADGRCAGANAPDWPDARQLWLAAMPWWSWPDQRLGPEAVIRGHACRWLRSRPARGSAIRVESCIDTDGWISWRTRLLRGDVELQRSDVIEAVRDERGMLRARKVRIRFPDGASALIHAYSGDAHYRPAPGAFRPPDACAAIEIAP